MIALPKSDWLKGLGFNTTQSSRFGNHGFGYASESGITGYGSGFEGGFEEGFEEGFGGGFGSRFEGKNPEGDGGDGKTQEEEIMKDQGYFKILEEQI